MSTSKRGFASMSQEKKAEISRKGGLSVKAEKRAFSRDSGLAARAGRLGAATRHRNLAAAKTAKPA